METDFYNLPPSAQEGISKCTIQRRSMDERSCKVGHRLLEFCKIINLRIVNDRTPGDSFGSHAVFNKLGESTCLWPDRIRQNPYHGRPQWTMSCIQRQVFLTNSFHVHEVSVLSDYRAINVLINPNVDKCVVKQTPSTNLPKPYCLDKQAKEKFFFHWLVMRL